MEKFNDKLSNLDVLLCGLAFTSRTETLEEYLKDKVKSLAVIALSSCFLQENLSACRLYENGVLKKEFKVANFLIKDYKLFRQPLILLVFIINWLSISFTILRLRKKIVLYIGISHSFAFIGAILKKVGVADKLIYYCIDYYIPERRISFNSLFVKMINLLDRFTVKSTDYVWDISSNIDLYREKIGGMRKESYRNTVVPLGYSSRLKRFKSINEINRWDIGFVGTITASQGLQLLVEAMPDIVKDLPQIRIRIIGEGHFLKELKSLVSCYGLNDYFTFYGFIKEEDNVLDILSSCAIGIAPWSDSIDNRNIICADPGKTKLYALCGLPIVTTKHCIFAQEIDSRKLGLTISYNREELKKAIMDILSEDKILDSYKERVYAWRESFISDRIFDRAFSEFFKG